METDCSRRSFVKGSAVATAAYIIGSPAIARTARASVIVVGAGAFGGWSALQLLQRGKKSHCLTLGAREIPVPAQAVRLAQSAPLMVLRISYANMASK